MAWQLTPETAEKHRKMRLRAGVRAFAAAAVILLLLALFYCAGNKILQKIAEIHWKKAITTAIKANESVPAAELLAKCRKQAPFLQKKPIFEHWEKEVFRLQQAEILRKQQFRQALNSLQNRLQTNPTADFPWQDELIKIAGLASDHSELAEVRSLEEHCKALTKIRVIKSAKTALQEIAGQEKAIENLTALKNQHCWQEHRKSQTAISSKLADLQTRHPEIPEIGKRVMQLKKLLEQAALAAAQAEKHAASELAAFKQILKLNNADILNEEIEKFRKTYPQSNYNAELTALQSDLKLLKIPFAQSLKKILAKMSENNRAAKNIYIKEIKKIVAEALQFGTFELIIQQDNNRIARFETLSRELFVKQSDGTYHIKFTALDNRPVKGVFTADGSGVVEYAGKIYRGRMIHGKTSGTLPESVKQLVLLKIQSYLQRCKDEDFPVFLCFLKQETAGGKFRLLPTEIKEKLQNAEMLAVKALKATAEQFVFTGNIITQCSENTPVFAGIIKLDGKTPEFITPPDFPHKNATLWVVNARQKPGFFKFGKLQNNVIVNSGSKLPLQQKYAVAAVPAKGMDYATQQAIWERTARRNQLKIPPLPEFL